MKRLTVLTLSIVLVLLLSVTLPVSATSNHAFRGHWTGIDLDGSNLALTFNEQSRSGGNVFDIQETDDMCTLCGGPPAKMIGVGYLAGANTLNASTVWWTVPTGNPVFPFPNVTYTYDPLTDTITDFSGVVFHRGP